MANDIFFSSSSQPSDMQNAFKQLESAISKRSRSLQDEIGLLSSVKELLEGELGSANLQRELVSKDLTAVTEVATHTYILDILTFLLTVPTYILVHFLTYLLTCST